MKPIKCVLIDDEIPGLTYLKMLCEQISNVEIVKVFNQSEKFIQEKDQLDFDLCISDIQMPGINGISLANLLQNKYFIFTTAFKEFAVEAYDLDVVDYITKPVKKERLEKAIEKVSKLLERSNLEKTKSVTLNTDKGKMVLFFEAMQYFRVSELDSRDKILKINDGSEVVLKNISFEKLATLLPSEHFVRINKREMIAVSIVTYFTHDLITTNLFHNEKPLQFVLSNNYRDAYLKLL